MYNHVVLGGTFDHFHKGHKDLLLLAFSKGEKVSLGLTQSGMNRQKMLATQIQSYHIREQAIKAFAKSLGREADLQVIPIHDIYGKTLTDTTLDAIVVTPHSRAGAIQINDERVRRGLSVLLIEECPLHTDNRGLVISSSRIRQGEIDRLGTAYSSLFSQDVVLNDQAKSKLKRPFGKAIGARKLRKSRLPIVVVGDVSARYAIENRINFQTAWIDGKTRKKEFTFEILSPYKLIELQMENIAGSITVASAQHVGASLNQTPNTVFRIQGEEDLLTVAAVLLLPFGTQVVYGYPYEPQSLRTICINERTKSRFAAILQP